MFIKYICIIAFLELSLSDDTLFLPMKKDSRYGDDVCSYIKDDKKYVRPCEKGKFCKYDLPIDNIYPHKMFEKESNIEICYDLPSITPLYTYDEGTCTNGFECTSSYECIGNKCSYECSSGQFFSKKTFQCIDNSLKASDGVCEETTWERGAVSPTITKYSSPNRDKGCAKLSFADVPNDDMKGIYYVNQKTYVYKGEVEDGEYVTSKEYCQSGFALYFYRDGKSEDPKDKNVIGHNDMYLRCVTPISVNSEGECSINYKIGENGETLRYNVEKLSTSYNTIKNNYCTEYNELYIKLKYEKYKEYYTKMSEDERKTCGDLDSTNKYSCQNNEVIKAWYYYKHPANYLAFNDRKKLKVVIDYLIQKDFPCYSLSQFIRINFIYLLFLLLIK